MLLGVLVTQIRYLAQTLLPFECFRLLSYQGLGSLSYFGHPAADTLLELLCLPFFRRPHLVFFCLTQDVALLALET